MDIDFDFDAIRPYRDHEVNEVVCRLVQDPSFIKFVQYILPSWHEEEIKALPSHIHSIKDFQKKVTYDAISAIREKTTTGITHSGMDRLQPDQSYLLITNHRDILLDSAFMNVLLYEQNLGTTEVAIGDNLLITPLITDLARLNRNFAVNRNVSSKQLYQYSLRLSAYIHTTLFENDTSVWIAQREGRTKDGDDRTQPGLLKMLGMHSHLRFEEAYRSLKILPVAISYEIEPCDVLKSIEMYKKEAGIAFTKKPQDDLNSMLTGLKQQKGKVHFAFGTPLHEELDQLATIVNKNEQIKEMAARIDTQIHQNYRLSPNNYIASDVLNATDEFSSHYSASEKETFLAYVARLVQESGVDAAAFRPIVLKMYANPLKNKIKAKVNY